MKILRIAADGVNALFLEAIMGNGQNNPVIGAFFRLCCHVNAIGSASKILIHPRVMDIDLNAAFLEIVDHVDDFGVS